ncbi:hypothetical protein [Streptosporangium sp. NPDC049078]|uniref:hypothetical protein n=1 Tax=Streptosporangium sp. NPDC049078 TaxID=3155767 RepID=UPI00341EE2BF
MIRAGCPGGFSVDRPWLVARHRTTLFPAVSGLLPFHASRDGLSHSCRPVRRVVRFSFRAACAAARVVRVEVDSAGADDKEATRTGQYVEVPLEVIADLQWLSPA